MRVWLNPNTLYICISSILGVICISIVYGYLNLLSFLSGEERREEEGRRITNTLDEKSTC